MQNADSNYRDDRANSLNNAADQALHFVWDTTKAAARQADVWAAGNPYKAAAAGAAIGLVSAVAFNKVLALNGGIAVPGLVYSTGKGAAMGYVYPATRRHAAWAFRAAAEGLNKATAAAQRASDYAQSRADSVLKTYRPAPL